MKATVKIEKEVDVKTLKVNAKVRYWEDTSVNGIEDSDGNLIPCRNGDNWSPIIDVDSGIITNWRKGTSADIHYKVCDCCAWELYDDDDNFVVGENDGYVPKTLSPADSGYGDYIIMKVDVDGVIQDWSFNIDDFLLED